MLPFVLPCWRLEAETGVPTGGICFLTKIYFIFSQKAELQREEETGICLPCSGSLPKWPQFQSCADLKTGARSFFCGSRVGAGAHLVLSSTAFSGCNQGATSDVKWPGYKIAPTWDTSTSGRILAHCARPSFSLTVLSESPAYRASFSVVYFHSGRKLKLKARSRSVSFMLVTGVQLPEPPSLLPRV